MLSLAVHPNLVECLQVPYRRRDSGIAGEHVPQVSDEHPELSTPVPYVVQPERKEGGREGRKKREGEGEGKQSRRIERLTSP